MSILWTTPITGSAQSGFTSPTYTTVADTAPSGNPGKQVVVTALGGTQAGVTTHTVNSPFTLNFTRSATLRTLGAVNPVTGAISSVPTNTYSLIVRKGVLVAANQPPRVAVLRITFDVPAGADSVDPSNLRACVSAAFGALSQQSAGFGDMTCNGVI
jgi:hypothetical protein